MRACLHCGNDFSVKHPSDPKKYCSHSCAATVNNREHPKRKKVIRICRACPCPCEGASVFCTAHQQKDARDHTLADVADMMSAKGKHPSWRWAYVRSLNRSWNEPLGRRCLVCGYTHHVELAHIRAISTFPLTTTLQVVNDPSNVLGLCPNHHWEFDHGLLTLEDIRACGAPAQSRTGSQS